MTRPASGQFSLSELTLKTGYRQVRMDGWITQLSAGHVTKGTQIKMSDLYFSINKSLVAGRNQSPWAVTTTQTYFGQYVSLSGDGLTAAITAYGGESYLRGPVYIYTRTSKDSSSWTMQANLVMSQWLTGTNGWNVGGGDSTALSADGNILVVGAPYNYASAGGAGQGAVLVFKRTGGSWAIASQLLPSGQSQVSYPRLGQSVAISAEGKTIVASAPTDSWSSNSNEPGSLFVWDNVGTFSSMSWQGTRIGSLYTGSTTGRIGGFPDSLDINSDGTIIAVGAPNDNNLGFGAISNGAVHIFTRQYPQYGYSWSEIQKITPSTFTYSSASVYPGASFGYSVALSSDGNTLAVGAPGDKVNTSNSYITGSFAVYTRTGGESSPTNTYSLAYRGIPTEMTAVHGAWGHSCDVSADGLTIIVGGPGYEYSSGGLGGNGAVFLLTTSANNRATWSSQLVKSPSDPAGAWAGNQGTCVAISGDGKSYIWGAPKEGRTNITSYIGSFYQGN